MWKKINIKVWDKYNYLTYIKHIWINNHKKRIWLYWCECWLKKTFINTEVRNNIVKSCWCYSKKQASININFARQFSSHWETHWLTNNKLYNIRLRMIGRCYWKNKNVIKNYKLKWVYVCDRWRCKYAWYMNFINDVEDKYNKSLIKYWQKIEIDKDILCDKYNIYPKVYNKITILFIPMAINRWYTEWHNKINVLKKFTY